MKRLLTILALALSGALTAESPNEPRDYSFYIKLGSGISCAQSPNIVAPSPPWNPAIQGYNANLGNEAIGTVGIGYELRGILDLEANISNRSTFKYRKYQTPTAGGASYTREFDLDVTPILFSINLLGKGISQTQWKVGCGQFYPMIGVGLGLSNLLLTNYRTTGLAPTGGSSPYPSFSSENQYTLRKNFTYSALVGVEYCHQNYWAIGTGYRWFDAGNFKGPSYQRVAGGSAVDVSGKEWEMRFRANEWFLELKIFL